MEGGGNTGFWGTLLPLFPGTVSVKGWPRTCKTPSTLQTNQNVSEVLDIPVHASVPMCVVVIGNPFLRPQGRSQPVSLYLAPAGLSVFLAAWEVS